MIYKTALQIAAEKGYTKIVQELLAQESIDINTQTVFNFYVFK